MESHQSRDASAPETMSRRLPSAVYVVLALAGAAALVVGIPNFTERLDDSGRPFYGWTAVLVGLVLAGGGGHVLWKRSRGERSDFDDR